MNFREISQSSDRALHESINSNNTSGYLTEDLVQVVRAAESGSWTTYNSIKEVMESLQNQ